VAPARAVRDRGSRSCVTSPSWPALRLHESLSIWLDSLTKCWMRKIRRAGIGHGHGETSNRVGPRSAFFCVLRFAQATCRAPHWKNRAGQGQGRPSGTTQPRPDAPDVLERKGLNRRIWELGVRRQGQALRALAVDSASARLIQLPPIAKSPVAGWQGGMGRLMRLMSDFHELGGEGGWSVAGCLACSSCHSQSLKPERSSGD
jgi:hypothetical protein